MLFALQLAAMNGEETVLNALDAILIRVEDDVREAELADVDELEASAWYQSSRPDRRKLPEKIAEASLHRSPRTRGPHLRRVVVNNLASATQARSIAHAPLLVLRHPLKFFENSHEGGKAGSKISGKSSRLHVQFLAENGHKMRGFVRGIPCPPLNKRTVENYIPDAIWRAWANAPDMVAARPMV